MSASPSSGMENLPACVGVPLSIPAGVTVRPAGSGEPAGTDQMTLPFSVDASSCCA